MEDEKQELLKKVIEQKAVCEEIVKRNNERRQVEEVKQAEEVQLLNSTIEQFQVCYSFHNDYY